MSVKNKNITFENLHGTQALPHFQDIARLRIKIFREFPFLYEGDLDYEREYLNVYLTHPESIIILCRNGSDVIGVSTAIPLQFEDDFVKKPFIEAKMDLKKIIYLGESVIEREFRGLGIGREFFERRLAHAKSLPGIQTAAFCTAIYDPKKAPADFNSPVHLWRKYGFQENSQLKATYRWKSIGDSEETDKEMRYYTREL